MFLNEKETRLTLVGPVGQLQAVLNSGDSQGALASRSLLAIVCHPHPQQGGTMDNKVVTTLMRTYRDLGVHVLRFNFRGVGDSQGEFANGVGELDDALAVIAWARQSLPECSLLLAGFSFGSSIAARASYNVDNLIHLTLVAPPVERYSYDREGAFNAPLCVIQGDQDERVIASGVYAWVAALKSPSQLIRYADAGHFFHGLLSRVKTDLTETLLNQIAH
ncbi:MAG TPA: CocE/NonD family hydrolase [Cellvibrio sp.]|nr:CocE/NonD family hydrolase [Cellvibrio sp.]